MRKHPLSTLWMTSLVITCCPALSHPVYAQRDSVPVIRTAKSGSWSDKATWEGGEVPGSGVKVHIQPDHSVVYDVESKTVIRSLHISGVMAFATDRSTRLEVGLIRIHAGTDLAEEGFEHGPRVKKTNGARIPGKVQCLCCQGKAALLVGTQEQPVKTGCTAQIRLRYIPGMDKKSCPAIICCGGRMDFHGAAMARTWLTLPETVEAGSDQVEVGKAPAGWKVGDRVIVTDTYGNFGAAGPETEECIIKKIHGSRLTLSKPMRYRHRGGGSFRGEIANLSRNVIVESADPDGIRGHTMYHVHSSGSISYAEFRHLGKRGIIGRYPLHYHLCKSTMRGSSVIGASIWDSGNRWLTIHGTEHLVVRDCVGYKSIGHGFFLEDGTEVHNVLDRNLAVRADRGEPLPDQELPFDKNEGAGFWWACSHNTFTNNRAVDCAGYGFRYEATPRAGFNDKSSGKSFGSPRARFNLRLPILQSNGTRKPVDIRTLPFVRFENNAAHNIANYGLNMGQDTGGIGPDKDHPFVIRNMTIWNAQRGYTVHVPNVKIDGMDIFRCGYEVYRARYSRQDYRNVYLRAVRGKYTVSDLESYLKSGQAVGKRDIGLNRARLPGFPRGEGAGGSSYNPSEFETATLTPVDDLPPTTVITHVRVSGKKVIVRGTTADNGNVKKVTVNGTEAVSLADNFSQWEAVLSDLPQGTVKLQAHAKDAKGNTEKMRHELPISLR